MAREEFYPSALTVAGSDSGGGAGIQADLRTFAAFGVYGCSAITAITAQNPFQVLRVDLLPAAAVTAQLNAVLPKFRFRAAKTGMLGNAEIAAAAATGLAGLACPLVVDPVMVATSGARLLAEDAVATVRERLLPLADWLTPNVPEAEMLTGRTIRNREEMAAAARECAERWQCSCVLKGGHLHSEDGLMTDIVVHGGKVLGLSSPVLEDTRASHGTGCTFSAALAAALAGGQSWKEALKSAKAFVYGSLVEEAELGPGLTAMYPPIESYLPEIILKRID